MRASIKLLRNRIREIEQVYNDARVESMVGGNQSHRKGTVGRSIVQDVTGMKNLIDELNKDIEILQNNVVLSKLIA